MKGLSRYGIKDRLRRMREQYANEINASYLDIDTMFENYLRSVIPQRQPKSRPERHAMQIDWLERQLKNSARHGA